jgi:hypothetical protein
MKTFLLIAGLSLLLNLVFYGLNVLWYELRPEITSRLPEPGKERFNGLSQSRSFEYTPTQKPSEPVTRPLKPAK